MTRHPDDCTCSGCEAELERVFESARPTVSASALVVADRLREMIGAPQIECGRCNLIGRVFGDYARAFAGAAAMLGFEAPEDVAPAMLLAQLRVSLQKRREAESKLKECAGLLAQNVEANKRALEQFRRLADLLDRGDVERARAEVAEVLNG